MRSMHSLSATRSDARAASIIRARPKPVGLSCRLTLRTVIRPTKLMVKCLRADDRHALAAIDRTPWQLPTDSRSWLRETIVSAWPFIGGDDHVVARVAHHASERLGAAQHIG